MAGALAKVPGIYGFLKRYTFKDLETSLATLRSDQKWCSDRGKVLLPMIVDRSYDGTNPMPADITVVATTGASATSQGYCAVRWHPLYVQRINVLIQRIGGNVATQETALGMSQADLDAQGYTPAKLVSAYQSIIHSAPRLVYWFFNFIARDQTAVADILSGGNRKLVAGGPDCWPTNDPLVQRAYPYYSTYDPMFVGITRESYSQPGYTIEQVYKYAVETLRIREVFWQYIDLFDQAVSIVNANAK